MITQTTSTQFYNLPSTQTFLVSQKALVFHGNQILILKGHTQDKEGKFLWELPGGFLEIDENREKGLHREVEEEAGLEIAIDSLMTAWDHWVQNFKFRDGRVVDVRIFEVAYLCSSRTQEVTLSQEHSEFKWIETTRLPQFAFAPNSKSAIDFWIQNCNKKRS